MAEREHGMHVPSAVVVASSSGHRVAAAGAGRRHISIGRSTALRGRSVAVDCGRHSASGPRLAAALALDLRRHVRAPAARQLHRLVPAERRHARRRIATLPGYRRPPRAANLHDLEIPCLN